MGTDNISKFGGGQDGQERQSKDSSQSEGKEDVAQNMQIMGAGDETKGMSDGTISQGTPGYGPRKYRIVIYGLPILLVIFVLYDIVQNQSWSDLIRFFLISLIIYGMTKIFREVMEYNPAYTRKYLLRMGKVLPFFLIILVFSFFAGIIESIRPFATLLILVSTIGILFSFFSMQQYRHLLTPGKSKSSSIEDKIKAELHLHDIKNFKPRFPKGLNWIGGFMTPLFPFFTVVNRNWKKNLSKEAFIHEHMHIFLMKFEGWSIYIVAGALFVPIMSWFAGMRGPIGNIFNMIVMAGILTMHEKVTFERTQHLARKFGITTRSWTSKIARKYWFIYSAWFIGIFYLITGFHLLYNYIIGVIV